jgi:hypothetical protein
LIPTQQFLSLTVANYEGTNGDYLVGPHSSMVSSLHSFSAVKPCEYNKTNEDCVPVGQHYFERGEILDFTFDLSAGQVVRFIYGIIGSEV